METSVVNFDLTADLTSCTPAFIAAMKREYGSAVVRNGAIEPVVAKFLPRNALSGTARILDGEGLEGGDKWRIPGLFDEVLIAPGTEEADPGCKASGEGD